MPAGVNWRYTSEFIGLRVPLDLAARIDEAVAAARARSTRFVFKSAVVRDLLERGLADREKEPKT